MVEAYGGSSIQDEVVSLSVVGWNILIFQILMSHVVRVVISWLSCSTSSWAGALLSPALLQVEESIPEGVGCPRELPRRTEGPRHLTESHRFGMPWLRFACTIWSIYWYQKFSGSFGGLWKCSMKMISWYSPVKHKRSPSINNKGWRHTCSLGLKKI